MAGSARYTALLDACVLFPVAICDALMSVAATGVYAPKWTRRIDEEWMRRLEKEKGTPHGTYATRCECMHQACPDWEVPEVAWAKLAPCLELPDAGDQHVLAAAIAGHADCLVTFNLRDFPVEVLGPLGIEVLHPDSFLVAQLDLDTLRVLPAFKKMRARLRNPAFTPATFADAMERNGLPQTASLLREAAELI
jgi:hypothetical protein